MQPQRATKRKKANLLERLREKYGVELGMEFETDLQKYTLDGTKDKKILIGFGDNEFIAAARNIEQAIKAISIFENKPITSYDPSKIITTYVYEEEEIETKIREEAMPIRFPHKTGIKMHGKRFYIVKKRPDGKSSGKLFCLYNWDTRNLLLAHWDKEVLLGFLQLKYKEIEHKDI